MMVDIAAPGKARRRYGLLALLISVTIIAALALGAVGLAWGFQAGLDRNIERIPALNLGHDQVSAARAKVPAAQTVEAPAAQAPAPLIPDADDAPVNFLLLGTDSRISAGDPTRWQAGAQRTDAIMLVQLSADRQALTVMSIPRDSWVEIPGHGDHKINAAFSFGGPLLTIKTVEHLTGVRIDHIAIADFESFAALTDELGGVEIALTQPLETDGESLRPGTQVLNGDQALHYARERYNVVGGDFGRVQRHQSWMRSIMARAFERDTLTDPGRLIGFLETVSQSVAVDESLSIGKMRDLAIGARNLRPEDVQFITAPHRGTGWSPDGRQSIVVLDEVPLRRISAAYADGTVAALLQENPDIAPRLGSEIS